MGDISAIHDKFIRSILSDKGIAVDYFKTSLPAFVQNKLDFSSLEQLPDSYVSDELRETVSGSILYHCPGNQRKERPFKSQRTSAKTRRNSAA